MVDNERNRSRPATPGEPLCQAPKIWNVIERLLRAFDGQSERRVRLPAFGIDQPFYPLNAGALAPTPYTVSVGNTTSLPSANVCTARWTTSRLSSALRRSMTIGGIGHSSRAARVLVRTRIEDTAATKTNRGAARSNARERPHQLSWIHTDSLAEGQSLQARQIIGHLIYCPRRPMVKLRAVGAAGGGVSGKTCSAATGGGD